MKESKKPSKLCVDPETLRELRQTPQTHKALCNGLLSSFCESPFDVSMVLEEIQVMQEQHSGYDALLKQFYEAQGNYLLWQLSNSHADRIDFKFEVDHPNFRLARSYAAILRDKYQSESLLFRIDMLRVRHAVYVAESVDDLEILFSIMNQSDWGLLQRACLDAEAAICLANKRHRSEELWESAFEVLKSLSRSRELLPSRFASFCYRWADTGISSNSQMFYSVARKCFDYNDACKNTLTTLMKARYLIIFDSYRQEH